jgi:hypothetical protein
VIEHIFESRIEIIVKLLGYVKARRDNKRAASLEGKRGESNAARLPAAHGQHDSYLALLADRVGTELGQSRIRFPLRYANPAVLANVWLADLEWIIMHCLFW